MIRCYCWKGSWEISLDGGDEKCRYEGQGQ